MALSGELVASPIPPGAALLGLARPVVLLWVTVVAMDPRFTGVALVWTAEIWPDCGNVRGFVIIVVAVVLCSALAVVKVWVVVAIVVMGVLIVALVG